MEFIFLFMGIKNKYMGIFKIRVFTVSSNKKFNFYNKLFPVITLKYIFKGNYNVDVPINM